MIVADSSAVHGYQMKGDGWMDPPPNAAMNVISSRLKSLTLQDLTLVVLCSLAIYLLRGRETHEVVPQWRYALNVSHYANGRYPLPRERLPTALITDLESDGKNEVVLITNDLRLEVLVLPGQDPELVLPHLYVKNSTRLVVTGNEKPAPYPVRLETGFVDEYLQTGPSRKQVIVVVFSNWLVQCYDHHLNLLWEHILLDTKAMDPHFYPKAFAVLISPHRVVKGDRGSIIIGGSFAHESNPKPMWENSDLGMKMEKSPGGIDPSKMKDIRERANRDPAPEPGALYTHFSTFCLSGEGTLRWHHQPGDFIKKPAVEKPDPIHWKLELQKQQRHTGEESWSNYRSDLYAQLPYLWSSLEDTRIELSVFKKNSQIPQDIQRTEVNTVADVFGEHIAGYAYGGARPHSHHEHVQHPNALIIHTPDGLEVLNLLSGAPIVRLKLAEEKTAFADINEDGTLERVKTNFEASYCDAEVVTLQPVAQVLFTGPLCSSPSWTAFSSVFLSDSGESEDTHVALPPMIVKNVAVRSSPAHHLMGRSLPSQRLGYDSVFLVSSGRLSSYGPYGEFNWQVHVPAAWNAAVRLMGWSHDRLDDAGDIFSNAFQPSLTSYSPLVFDKKTAAIVVGWNNFALVNLRDGHLLGEHSLPCQPIGPPALGDFNNDGWTDFIISCPSGHIGLRIQPKPGYMYLFLVAVTVVLGMYVLTWCFQPEPDDPEWDHKENSARNF